MLQYNKAAPAGWFLWQVQLYFIEETVYFISAGMLASLFKGRAGEKIKSVYLVVQNVLWIDSISGAWIRLPQGVFFTQMFIS